MIKFNCRPDDGTPFSIIADSRDVIEWENRGKGRHLGMIQATPRMLDLSELCYLACRRTKTWTGDLSDFRAQVAVVPVRDEPDEDEDRDGDALLDPTRPGA